MAKILKCPSCQEKIDVTDLSGGSTVRCEACGTMVRIATGTTGKVPQAAPPPPPPPPAPARKERGTTKMRQKEKGATRVGRQTDLFRKMSSARAPGEGGRPRGGGGGDKAQGGSNTGMIIAIAAAAIVVIGGVAFAVLHKSEPEPTKASAGKEKENAPAAKKKKKEEAAPPKSTYTPPAPTDTSTFKPGARAMAGVGKDVPDMRCSPEAKTNFEGMVTSGKVAEVVAQDFTWITYVIDGLLSDNEAVAKGSMEALHLIINKRKMDARMSDLAKNPIIGGFNMPEMRSGEYTYWAQWWFTKSARDAVAGWAESAGSSGGTSGNEPSAPRVAAGNPQTEAWEETLRKCRSGGFHNSSNPEFYEFQRIKGMGKSAYPHLIRFIDHEDTSLGSTAVLILKELSGRSEQPSRVTEANKTKIKEDWEGWLKSGP